MAIRLPSDLSVAPRLTEVSRLDDTYEVVLTFHSLGILLRTKYACRRARKLVGISCIQIPEATAFIDGS